MYLQIFTLFVIFIIAFFAVAIILHKLSDAISAFGLYHKLDYSEIKTDGSFKYSRIAAQILFGFFILSLLGAANKEYERFEISSGEPFSVKISKTTRLYVYLSAGLFLTYFVIIKNQIFILKIDPDNALLLSITLSVITLLIVRILTNPHSPPKIFQTFQLEKENFIEEYRERLMSGVYSYISIKYLRMSPSETHL